MEKQTRTLIVNLEIPIEAEKEVVWDALVNDIHLWWRKDFSATGSGKIILEPKLGGKMYEDCGEGTGLVWYTVEAIKPMESMLLSGVLGQEWGGPARTLLSLKLEATKSGSKIKIVDSYIGHVTDQAADSFEKGWMTIFGEALKPYAEKKATQ